MGMARLRVAAVLFIAATSTARVVYCFVTPTGTAHRGICKLDLGHKEGPCRARCRPRSAASTEASEALLPPKDDTFGLAASVRDVLTAPEVPEGADRYDRFGGQTGGTWRSRIIGFIPCTVVASPACTKWLANEEARGTVLAIWPASTKQVLGAKSLTSLSSEPKAHASTRKVLSVALSPKAVVELQPILEALFEKRVLQWAKYAESGEEIMFLDEIAAFTVGTVCRCFLGDYATDKIVEDIARIIPFISAGMLSIPRRFPWPLNKLPALCFGPAMNARREFHGIIEGVLREHRADMVSAVDSEGLRSAGALDTFIAMQRQQIDNGGPEEGQTEFDDSFIMDNILTVAFAGYETTSATIARILQMLGSAEGKYTAEKVLQELNESDVGSGNLSHRTPNEDEKQALGVFAAYPLLDAVVLETSRLYPAVAGVFRQSVEDLTLNGFLIPAGTTIAWDLAHGLRAQSLYPKPEKFCPFRFFHGDSKDDGTTPALPGNEQQPRPELFGFGKHLCPGRDLAKLEILLFLKTFLSKFDYDLVEGQSFKSILPASAPKDRLRVVLKAKSVA